MSQPVYGTPDGPVQAGGEWSVEERLRQQAVRNLRRRAAFRLHLLVYSLVNVALVVVWSTVWATTGFGYPWWLFPASGWGIGLGIHGWTAYRGDEYSEERIRAEMARILGA